MDRHHHALSCSHPVPKFPCIYSTCTGTHPSLAFCQEIQICNFLTSWVIISNPYLVNFLKSEEVESLFYPVRPDSRKSIAPGALPAFVLLESSACSWRWVWSIGRIIQGVSKRALQIWKLIEIYTEDIHNVLNWMRPRRTHSLPARRCTPSLPWRSARVSQHPFPRSVDR